VTALLTSPGMRPALILLLGMWLMAFKVSEPHIISTLV
jgi:hypothetical protein